MEQQLSVSGDGHMLKDSGVKKACGSGASHGGTMSSGSQGGTKSDGGHVLLLLWRSRLAAFLALVRRELLAFTRIPASVGAPIPGGGATSSKRSEADERKSKTSSDVYWDPSDSGKSSFITARSSLVRRVPPCCSSTSATRWQISIRTARSRSPVCTTFMTAGSIAFSIRAGGGVMEADRL